MAKTVIRIGQTLSVRSDEPVGLIAARYQVLELLGRGGMGEVRAGIDQQLDRPVAIKFLRADLADVRGVRDRFEREARAAARVSHPNVVAVFDIGEHDGVPYIVMERLSGRTLADDLAVGAMEGARVRAVALELLGALGAAHRLGVLHRDIKPGNILVTDTGQVKVGDFGIAKLAEDRHDTTVGSMFGTVSYLAPERLAGKPATAASDVYSVGVVLFEALTGAPAFCAETPLALARAVADDMPAFTDSQRSQSDGALVAAVERALQKDPRARFPSADEMAAAIGAPLAAAQVPTVPVAVDLAAQPTRPVAVDPGPAVVAQTAVLPRDARPVAARRYPSRRRARTAMSILGLLAIGVVAVLGFLVFRDDTGTTPPSATPSTATPPVSVPPTGPPGSGTSSRDSSIPAPLSRAIDALDRAAR